MSITKIIAKFLKEGFVGLEAEEKELLKNNVSLLSPAQKKKFDDAEKEEEANDDDADDDGADADADDDGADADADADDDAIDQKALQTMISKGVQEEINGKMEKIATGIANNFVKNVDKQRKKAIDTGVEAKDEGKSETRDFVKALLDGDKTKLMEISKKTTTFNQSGDDARGGYLIPDELKAEVLRIAETQYGLCRREFLYMPFTGPGNERKVPTLASGFDAEWVDEATAKASGNPTFGLVTQTLKKLAKIIPFTEEILEDSAINLTQLVAQLFAESVAKQEDLQFLNGTGSPWTGILNNGSVGSVALAVSAGVSAITFEKLIDMQDECPSGVLPGAKYYMNRQIFSYLRKLRNDAVSASDSAGAFLLPLTKTGIEDILGFPIELSDAMPGKTLTGAGKPFVIFGNLKVAAIFGDKQQIRAKMLDQATITDGDGTTSINLAEQDMIALRLEERVGYVLALPTAVVVLKTGPVS